MRPCPNCEIAGKSFKCTNHVTTYGPEDPAPSFTPLTNDQVASFLYAEIGRLHVQLREKEEQHADLLKVLLDLQNKGIIDHHFRVLPLKGHVSNCPQGQSGWAYCTCDLQKETEELEAAMGFGMEKPATD